MSDTDQETLEKDRVEQSAESLIAELDRRMEKLLERAGLLDEGEEETVEESAPGETESKSDDSPAPGDAGEVDSPESVSDEGEPSEDHQEVTVPSSGPGAEGG
jgi:hypothetical protein